VPKPAVFMDAGETGDVPVYYAYQGTNPEPLQYQYQVELDGARRSFDVRDLAALMRDHDAYAPACPGKSRRAHRDAIRSVSEAFGALLEALLILCEEPPGVWYKALILQPGRSTDYSEDGRVLGVAHYRADGHETLCGKRLGCYEMVQERDQILWVCPECLEVVGGAC